jgi:adenine/guanine phosphoribosyltransferase-like PRPP-binding protein
LSYWVKIMIDEAGIWAVLQRGGAVRRNAASPDGSEGESQLSKYNGLLDPPGAEALGNALARQVADSGATLVVVWEDVEDVVLGFVVGRHLGVPVLRAFNADGLVGHSGPLPSGARAIFVTDCARDPVTFRALRVLLERAGGSLLGAAALVSTHGGDTPLLASLVALRDQSSAESAASRGS